ncbi:MAG TPA: BrnT family toxin [Bdellovibrionota bacterium]|nr:BrnT family toxin [Bdellovibrionota bacterium]
MAKFEVVQWFIDWLFGQRRFAFDWDDGNLTKSKTKHGVETFESEEIFYDETKVPLGIQVQPPVSEPRFGLLGKTNNGRMLHIVFTIREGNVRIIAARPMHKKERVLYEKNLRKK